MTEIDKKNGEGERGKGGDYDCICTTVQLVILQPIHHRGIAEGN